MKRNIIFVLASFLIVLKGTSQNTLGLKAGINLAYQTVTSTSAIFPHSTQQTKPLFGYQFGIFYKAKITKKLTFSTETNFSLVGASDKYLTLPVNGDTALRIQYVNNKIGYIEVPLMLQHNLNRFYVSAGSALSFKLFSKSALSGSALYYNSFDLAGKLLTGYRVSKKWDINICYSYGLINVNKSPGTAATKKNKYLNLSLLYTLK